jgi:hypothetical protein
MLTIPIKEGQTQSIITGTNIPLTGVFKIQIQSFRCAVSDKFITCNRPLTCESKPKSSPVDTGWLLEYTTSITNQGIVVDWDDKVFDHGNGMFDAVIVKDDKPVGRFQIQVHSCSIHASKIKHNC